MFGFVMLCIHVSEYEQAAEYCEMLLLGREERDHTRVNPTDS